MHIYSFYYVYWYCMASACFCHLVMLQVPHRLVLQRKMPAGALETWAFGGNYQRWNMIRFWRYCTPCKVRLFQSTSTLIISLTLPLFASKCASRSPLMCRGMCVMYMDCILAMHQQWLATLLHNTGATAHKQAAHQLLTTWTMFSWCSYQIPLGTALQTKLWTDRKLRSC